MAGRHVLALSVVLLVPVRGPTPGAQAAFDVATVKLAAPPLAGEQYNINLGTIRNGRVTLSNVTLSDCLRFAYGIVSDAELAGPDWIKSKAIRFDIVGQAGTPRDRLLSMLQALLAERLRLVAHREQRELPYLAVVQAKNGSKVRSAKEDTSQTGAPMLLGHIVSPQISMPTLAMLLSRFERQTILDKTGLDGFYEVKLDWVWHRDRPAPPGGDATGTQQQSDAGPSLFAALEEQLGLKLEARKAGSRSWLWTARKNFLLKINAPPGGKPAKGAGATIVSSRDGSPAGTMNDLHSVGHPTPRVDALKRVKGTATYTGDIQIPGMLHAPGGFCCNGVGHVARRWVPDIARLKIKDTSVVRLIV